MRTHKKYPSKYTENIAKTLRKYKNNAYEE